MPENFPLEMDKMEEQDLSCRSADRRRYARRSVYSFVHATATLSDTTSTEETNEHQIGNSWTGLLVDLSCEGAQIIMSCGCEKYLREHQNVAMRIKTTLNDADIKLTAQVKCITLTESHDAVRIGVQFTELKNNPDVKDAISRIYRYGEKLKAVNTA